jgi:D-isomer specific 2-hydroxyacid dehydrogenase, NAD binding domain
MKTVYRRRRFVVASALSFCRNNDPECPAATACRRTNDPGADPEVHGVVLVNCARGGIYQEEALAAALNSGKVGAAAIGTQAVGSPSRRA